MTTKAPEGSDNQPRLDKLITLKEAAALGELSYSHLRRLASLPANGLSSSRLSPR